MGFWKIDHYDHNDSEVEVVDINGSTVTVNYLVHTDEFYSSDKVYSARWNFSFDMANQKELEIGFSAIKGRGSFHKKHKDNVEITKADITFRWFPSAYKKWTFQNEWMHLKREIPSCVLNRNGFCSFLNYRIDKYYD